MAISSKDQQYAGTLKMLRKKHGLIQLAAAEALGLESQQQYSDLEKGKKHFSEDLIIRICSFFRISILDFTGLSQQKTTTHYLSEQEAREIAEAPNNEIRVAIYKKLLLEARIQNIEHKLATFQKNLSYPDVGSGKYRIHVLI